MHNFRPCILFHFILNALRTSRVPIIRLTPHGFVNRFTLYVVLLCELVFSLAIHFLRCVWARVPDLCAHTGCSNRLKHYFNWNAHCEIKCKYEQIYCVEIALCSNASSMIHNLCAHSSQSSLKFVLAIRFGTTFSLTFRFSISLSHSVHCFPFYWIFNWSIFFCQRFLLAHFHLFVVHFSGLRFGLCLSHSNEHTNTYTHTSARARTQTHFDATDSGKRSRKEIWENPTNVQRFRSQQHQQSTITKLRWQPARLSAVSFPLQFYIEMADGFCQNETWKSRNARKDVPCRKIRLAKYCIFISSCSFSFRVVFWRSNRRTDISSLEWFHISPSLLDAAAALLFWVIIYFSVERNRPVSWHFDRTTRKIYGTIFVFSLHCFLEAFKWNFLLL